METQQQEENNPNHDTNKQNEFQGNYGSENQNQNTNNDLRLSNLQTINTNTPIIIKKQN